MATDSVLADSDLFMPRLTILRGFKLCLIGISLAVLAHAATPADQAFEEIWQKEWAWRLSESPMLATSVGEHRFDDRLGDVSSARQRVRLRYLQQIERELAPIKVAELSESERINFAIYHAQIANQIKDIELRGYLMVINSDSSFYDGLSQLGQLHPFKTEVDFQNYLARLEAIPSYLDQHIALMEEGLKRGMSAPQITLVGRDAALLQLMDVANVDTHELFQPFTDKRAERLSTPVRTAMQKRARALIQEQVGPAFAKLHAFIKNRYLTGARTTLAARALPQGEAFYRQQILAFATLNLEPDAIHEIGLKEVARIEKDMQAIMDELKFKGSLREFVESLRADPQFYVKDPEQLLIAAAWIAKRIDGELPSYFGVLPRQPFGIQPVPAAIAPFYTAGRYNGAPEGSHAPGFYWVNTHNLASRPLYSLPALTLHEAVPGHHLQIALAAEQRAQPPFRRFSYISAYGEGWALYAEELGLEMGIYRTPYERFGQLSYRMWRATRLVVDTGIHWKGWSRERALNYMSDRTALSSHEVETEIDRYISWPGQALSYMLGCIQIKNIRQEAEAKLGQQFDIRAFHDKLLSLGSVPLEVLTEQMRGWIIAQAAHTAK
jgi:uncharacterized protein (DUF885 family)